MNPGGDEAERSREDRAGIAPAGGAKGELTARQVPTRHGAHIELGEPVWIGGNLPWACPAKLVGRDKRLPSIRFDDDDDDSADLPRVAEPEEPEPTHTLLLRTGRGRTPEEARADAVRRVEDPLSAHPSIMRRETQSPPPPLRIFAAGTELDMSAAPPAPHDMAQAQPGLWSRLRRWWRGS